MRTCEVIEGQLQPDGSLRLDGKPELPAGRVRVTLEAVSDREDVWLVLDRIRDRRRGQGEQRRTRQEIDDDVRAIREEWDSPTESSRWRSDAGKS